MGVRPKVSKASLFLVICVAKQDKEPHRLLRVYSASKLAVDPRILFEPVRFSLWAIPRVRRGKYM